MRAAFRSWLDLARTSCANGSLLNRPGAIQRGVQCFAELEHHPDAGVVLPELDQRDVVAIDTRAQCQVSLTPLATCSEAAKGLPECLIWFHHVRHGGKIADSAWVSELIQAQECCLPTAPASRPVQDP